MSAKEALKIAIEVIRAKLHSIELSSSMIGIELLERRRKPLLEALEILEKMYDG
jgi:hypothetical protein